MKISPAQRRRIADAFGAALKSVRQQRGLSQEHLADDANLDRTLMSLYERGGRSPTLVTLFELARALGIEVTQLVADTVRQLREQQS
jgi:transcriptional regulator with XRE-family HTH domain